MSVRALLESLLVEAKPKKRVYELERRKRKTWMELSREIEAGEREKPGGDTEAYGRARKVGDREYDERKRRDAAEAKAAEKKSASAKKAAEGAAKSVKALTKQRKDKYKQWRSTVGKQSTAVTASVGRLLGDLVTEADKRLMRLKRAARSGGPVERAMYWLAIERVTGKERSPLIAILQTVVDGKRPTAKQLGKIKGRLRSVPGFVRRLYVVSRISSLLSTMLTTRTGKLLDRRDRVAFKASIARLAALPPFFDDTAAEVAMGPDTQSLLAEYVEYGMLGLYGGMLEPGLQFDHAARELSLLYFTHFSQEPGQWA